MAESSLGIYRERSNCLKDCNSFHRKTRESEASMYKSVLLS